ncbi:Trifunctional UDP-glucose 4,6-dehydratase/UDP-4-keto-6-deoxy-D-glucose 3,5-epimerase/UDP-4-keto-L-rhamnose-reductase RHM1 [Dirofilaria immitis]
MSIYTPRNVLVTGGCGFIGSNFVNYIFRAWPRTNIVNIDKLILNSDAFYIDEEVIKSSRYKLITTDIRNFALIWRILNENKIDTVIHFAADCTSTRCYDDPIESIENNVIAYIQFLECIRSYNKVERFIHISTDEVYGDSSLTADEKGKEEDALLLPGNPYAATKAACESYIHICCESLPVIILRINNIYGPNQWDVKVIPHFIKLAKNIGKFTVQGSGTQLRSWLFVDDAAEGIRKAVESGIIHEIYNIGTYFEMNVIDLAHVIQAEVDRQLGRNPTPVEFVAVLDRPYNDLRYLIDYSKINLDTGWSPKVTFEEGISRVVALGLTPPKKNQKMLVVIYGGEGWIGKQCCKKLSERKILFTLAKCRIGRNSDKEILDELNGTYSTHVLCCTGRTHGGKFKTVEYLEGGPKQTFENIRDNLYSTMTLARICQTLGLHFTYIGTGYLFAYDQEHPIGGESFTDDDLPTFFGNSYSIVKGITDRMIQQYQGGIKECLNARITLPLNFCLDEERNLLTKILEYKQILDVPVSITILDDCIPALIDLMEKRVGGNLNLVNPQPITFSQILELYKEIVCSDLHHYEILDAKDDKYRELCATKGNCALNTSKLEQLCPKIPSSFESLRKCFMKMRDTSCN